MASHITDRIFWHLMMSSTNCPQQPSQILQHRRWRRTRLRSGSTRESQGFPPTHAAPPRALPHAHRHEPSALVSFRVYGVGVRGCDVSRI